MMGVSVALAILCICSVVFHVNSNDCGVASAAGCGDQDIVSDDFGTEDVTLLQRSIQVTRSHAVTGSLPEPSKAGADPGARSAKLLEADHPVEKATGLKTPKEEASDSKYWKDVHVYVGPERVFGKTGQLHGQVGQDWLVASMMGCKKEGFFLDLAANEPESLSNTLMLERDFGWNGICVEANKKWLYGLAQRKCKQVMGVAGSPSNQEVKFALHEGSDGLAGIVGPTTDNKDSTGQKVDLLRTVRIEDFLGRLDAPPQIDYFSLDVEGAESIVMQGFNWNKYRFSIITIERPKPDLIKDLNNAGYKMLRTNADFGDYTWVDSKLSGYEEWAATWANHNATGLPVSCLDAQGYKRPTSLKP